MPGWGVASEALRGATERARAGEPSALLLVGEPGIGKSTLLDEACHANVDAMVLRATGAEQERDLPLAALIQLLRPVRQWFGKTSDHHNETLISAIDNGEPPDRIPLALAVLDLLGTIADEFPLTILVLDDAQWIDELSAVTLQFAMRRLTDVRVATLLAARKWSHAPFSDVHMVEVPGVDDGTARSILSTAGAVRPEVARHARSACGGNPFVLKQLADVLTPGQRAGLDPLPDVVPMGPALAAVLRTRIDHLPEATRVGLSLLAVAGTGDRGSLSKAWEALGVSSNDLMPAEQDGVVVARSTGFEFSHPLLRSAVLTAMGSSLRRRVHRALADALPQDSLDRRAHHLDLATDGPDPKAAEVLEQAAIRATHQGAHDVAGAMWERAANNHQDPPTVAHRLGEAGTAYWRAYRPERGIRLCEQAIALLDQGPARAGIVFALGDMMALWSNTQLGVQMLVDEVAAVRHSAPEIAAAMMSQAATMCALGGDVRRALEYCEQAEGIAASADGLTQIACRSITTHIRVMHGDAPALAPQIAELEAIAGLIGDESSDQLLALGQLVMFDLMVLGRWRPADELADRVATQARQAGLRGIESFLHGMRGEMAWRRGRWLEARAEALLEVQFDEAHDGTGGSFAHGSLARVDAAMGRLEASGRNAALAVNRGERIGMAYLESWGRHARALAALADGRPAAALADTQPILTATQMGDAGEPGILWWHGDHLEALWRTSDHEAARRFVAHLDEQATRSGSAWASAIVLRGTGLLDRDPDALRASGEALDAIDAPFEAARSRALVGEIAPSTAHRSELSRQVEVFAELGAHPWTARTAALIGQEPAASRRALDGLTDAELRVAATVAQGLTNRDAADALFLSPKTVDAHLQRIYRKLGVHSRTELAMRLTTASRS